MKIKSLPRIFLVFLVSVFIACNNDKEHEKQVSLTPKVVFVQDGEELPDAVLIRIFKADKEFLKAYTYDTEYHYFVRKNDNAAFLPSYILRTYPPFLTGIDRENERISIDTNTIYTISYRIGTGSTASYFVEYNVEVGEEDFTLERRFTIDQEGNVSGGK